MNLSACAVVRAIDVPRVRIERLSREEADTVLRLAKYFVTTAAFWMGLQAQHDLERAEGELRKDLRKIEPVRAPAALSASLRGCLRVNTHGRL